MRTINGRPVPDGGQFSALGESVVHAMDNVGNILVELANLLGAVVDGDDVDCDNLKAATALIGGVNGAEFESTGFLKMNSGARAYKDLVFPLIQKNTGPGNPTFTAFIGNHVKPQFAVGDGIQLECTEHAHELVEGGSGMVHLHYTSKTNVGAARYVKWGVDVAYVNNSDGVAQWVNPSELIVEHTIPANTPVNTEFFVSMGNISVPDMKIGGQWSLRLRRILADGTAPADDPFVTQVGIHAGVDTLGSRTVSAK